MSNVSVIDIAADLGRTVKAVRARAHTLRIALGRSRFSGKRKGKTTASCPQGSRLVIAAKLNECLAATH